MLSLLVDSPQKQAAYLSKTLALNPDHEKAKEQLAALRATGSLAPTSTIEEADGTPLDVVAQADSDQLPEWLQEHGGEQPMAAKVAEVQEETAVANEALPDWLKEPATVESNDTADAIEESPTIVGQTDESASDPEKTADKIVPTTEKPNLKAAKSSRPKPQSTQNLNIILGLLIIVAIIVLITLAYLLLS